MEERRGDYSPTSSLKHRLKNSIKSCFKNNNNNNHPHQHHQLHNDNDNDNDNPPHQQQHHQHRTLVRSSSGMMRHLINRIGTPRASHHHHHRKSKSTDFRYDLQSYALNFDDDDNAAFRDDFPFRDFTSRLPPSPPSPQPHHPTTSSPTRPWEITACS